jgi:flagellar motor switch protein FliN/FliY
MTPVETENAPQAETQVQPLTETPAAPPPQAAAAAAAPVEVHEAELADVQEQSIKAPSGQIDILLDTAVPVTASLGSAEVLVRDILQWGPGSVLKLERRTGEPVELYLRGVKFATGYIVVVGDQLGIRIKEILSSEPAKGAETQ